MKRAKPFPTGDLTPYLQAYVVTLESGAVVLARVMGPDRPQGQQAARAAVLATFPAAGQVWDLAAYPVGPQLAAQGPGLSVILTEHKKGGR